MRGESDASDRNRYERRHRPPTPILDTLRNEENHRQMARVQLLVLLVVCLCAGCGGGNEAAEPNQGTTATRATTTEATEPNQDPANFLKEMVNRKAVGQYGRVWEALHPLHQAVALRAEYVDCESRDPFRGEIRKIEVVDQYDEPLRIPGQTKDVPSTAVSLRVTVKLPLVEKPQVVTSTGHAVAEGGEWRWVMPPEDYEAYKADRCPPPQ
jgi:hypothetical protein